MRVGCCRVGGSGLFGWVQPVPFLQQLHPNCQLSSTEVQTAQLRDLVLHDRGQVIAEYLKWTRIFWTTGKGGLLIDQQGHHHGQPSYQGFLAANLNDPP